MPISGLFGHKRRWYALATVAGAMGMVAYHLLEPRVDTLWPLLLALYAVSLMALLGGIMLWWAPGLLDTYPRKKTLRILLEGTPPLLLYSLALRLWPDLVADMAPGPMQSVAAMLPAVLVLWASIAFVRYLRMLDELQQRLELVSLAMAAGLVGLACTAAGFLHAAGIVDVPGTAGIWIFPLLAVGYSLIRLELTRRYQ